MRSEPALQSFDQVEAQAIGRQPEDGDPISMNLEPRLNRFGIVEPRVVANQADLSVAKTNCPGQRTVQDHG